MNAQVRFFDLHPPQDRFLDDVLTGLRQPQKQIPAKYFYDQRGCELFDAICELPEYYPTRTETAMMHTHAAEIAQLLGEDCLLIEYGSGTSQKTRILLDHLSLAAYMPIDIAGEQVRQSSAILQQIYPDLNIVGICADYTHAMDLPALAVLPAKRKVIFFPGSTIGNFTKEEAQVFLRDAATLVGSNGAMLIGVDLKKSPDILNAAYNDAQDVTAAFNFNLLTRINSELGANIDIANFRHHAFYDEDKGRIEMHLLSLKDQAFEIQGNEIRLRKDETIHTENSCKYSVKEFQEMAQASGFKAVKSWVDQQQLFGIHYLVAG